MSGAPFFGIPSRRPCARGAGLELINRRECRHSSAILDRKEIAHPGALNGRLIFIHLQCWEVLPFCRSQRQRCIKILSPKDPEFYTPLALKTAKGQHLPALEVYKNQSLIKDRPILRGAVQIAAATLD